MTLDPRTPVLVGAGVAARGLDQPGAGEEASELMASAVAAAAVDSGRPGLLRAVQLVAVPRGTWSYADPGRLVAARIGSPNATTVLAEIGIPQQTLGGGMERLLLQPDQRQQLAGDTSAIPVAVEKMLRWVSPIKNMCRTVTADTSFFGADLRAGQKIMLLYEPANFDERQFTDSERFDAARRPNEHLAFGFGTHVCLRDSLARLELRVMFERVLSRLDDLELATDQPLPRRPANFTPTSRVGPS